jgi:small subunit ribosomal protein S4e
MHLKRNKVPKNWPVKRKGTAYVVRSNFNVKNGIPILVFLRDLLKVAQNRKEVKKVIFNKQILINEIPVSDEKNVVSLFDVVKLVPSKKNYRVIFTEKGVFGAKEITEKESLNKISKVKNKKMLKNKKMQLNLSDGNNFISDTECNTNDSVIINFKDKKIEKCLPLKEKSNVIVIGGKYAGKEGIVNALNKERKMAELKADEGNIHVLIKQIMVTK